MVRGQRRLSERGFDKTSHPLHHKSLTGHLAPSPFSRFTYPCPHGHFSRPKSAGHAPVRTCIAKFSYLAKSDANTGYEPKKFDKITFVDDDTMLINDLNQNFSDFSKKHIREHWTVPCSHNVLNPLFRTFLMMILLFKETAEKACIGKTDCWTERERETESMSKKGQRNGISVSVKSHRKSCSEESQKILF